ARLIDEGVVPNIAEIARQGMLRPMTSVHPWVSSVAWTTLPTGVNPAKHNIFGFIDRVPATHQLFVPLNTQRKAPTLWERLNDAGKRSVVVNVPVSYPVRPINGAQIAGFLAPKLDERSVYPSSLLPQLQEMGYRIDTDAQLARKSRAEGMADIQDALEKRLRALLHLLDNENWDYFQFVIMETDRLHHFFLAQMEADDPVWKPAFYDIYRRIDQAVGEVRRRLDPQDLLVLAADHGFCTIRKEVYFNVALAEAGFLKYRQDPSTVETPRIDLVAPQSTAYILDPGRVFVNLKGREKDGSVDPADYERVRDELIAWAEALTDPETGERVVTRAYRREELYNGPFLDQAADVILAPVDGYDPKGAIWKPYFVHKDEMMVGMHTYANAMLCLSQAGVIHEGEANILDLAPMILRFLGLDIPGELDGRAG
ncbi:MAG: alkaline phosphatase family protein, partial [Caldilineaceae bacterium]|nr:alkaline phosphatase family protein [Caldilineaceae bacterium]